MAVRREDFPAFGKLMVNQHKKIWYFEKSLSLSFNERPCMFWFSPDKAHISDEFEVQPYVFGLALTGLKRRVHGASRSSFCHQQTITINIQVTLVGEQRKKLLGPSLYCNNSQLFRARYSVLCHKRSSELIKLRTYAYHLLKFQMKSIRGSVCVGIDTVR